MVSLGKVTTPLLPGPHQSARSARFPRLPLLQFLLRGVAEGRRAVRVEDLAWASPEELGSLTSSLV